MKSIAIISLLFCFCSSGLYAQYYKKHKKSKLTYAKRTYFGYWGYHRSYYTKSDLQIIGPDYNMTYQNCQVTDNAAPFNIKNYFSSQPLIRPQISAKVGVYFKNYWAVSIGYDRFKYYMRNRSRVFIAGIINPEADSINYGGFDGAEYVIDTSVINYQNDGMNYLRLEFTRTIQWYNSSNDAHTTFSTDFGIGMGPVISKNNLLFLDKRDVGTISLSGFGTSANIGARLELYNRIFFQLNFNGGFIGQSRVRTRQNDVLSYSKQNIGFASFNFGIGLYLFGKSVNGCGTCPDW